MQKMQLLASAFGPALKTNRLWNGRFWALKCACQGCTLKEKLAPENADVWVTPDSDKLEKHSTTPFLMTGDEVVSLIKFPTDQPHVCVPIEMLAEAFRLATERSPEPQKSDTSEDLIKRLESLFTSTVQ